MHSMSEYETVLVHVKSTLLVGTVGLEVDIWDLPPQRPIMLFSE